VVTDGEPVLAEQERAPLPGVVPDLLIGGVSQFGKAKQHPVRRCNETDASGPWLPSAGENFFVGTSFTPCADLLRLSGTDPVLRENEGIVH